MSLIPSFALAKALRDVERFKPTGDQMHDLVAEIRAWLDRVKFQRGEIIERAVKPRRSGRGYKALLYLDEIVLYLTHVQRHENPSLSD